MFSTLPELDFSALIEAAHANPMLLFAILMLFAVMQEDVATATIALLAAHGHVAVQLGFGAVMCGILLGDLGIFTAGWFARGHRYALHVLAKSKIRRVKRVIKRNLIPTILITRCLPGMRLPTYFALGFFHASPSKFFLVAIGAIALWSAFLFSLSYVIGDHVLRTIDGPGFWAAIIGFIAVIVVVPRMIMKRIPAVKELTQ